MEIARQVLEDTEVLLGEIAAALVRTDAHHLADGQWSDTLTRPRPFRHATRPIELVR